MVNRKISKGDYCVYCGSTSNITLDHIPPKLIFSKPYPPFITVPSCATCNWGFQKDDEYFRIALTIWEPLHDNVEVTGLREKILRGFGRPQMAKLRENILRSFVDVEMVSPSGLYLGTKPAFNVDDERLCRVAKRIAKGLFYHERGERLHQDFDVVSYSEFSFRKISANIQQNIINNLIPILKSTPLKIIGKNAFEYGFSFVPNKPNFSAWLFLFYKRVPFLCLTLPRDVIQNKKNDKNPK